MGWKSSFFGSVCAFALTCAGASAAEPVRIGLIEGITGSHAESWVSYLRAATLAVEEVNREGGVLGRPLELVPQDSQYTAPGTVLAASKLTADPSIVAIILPVRSSLDLAAMPVIARRGIPAIARGTHYAITHSSNRWVVSMRVNIAYKTRAMADFGTQTLHARKWAIVHSTDAVDIDCKDRLEATLKAGGLIPVTVQPINVGAQNFAPAIKAMRNKDIDLVASCVSVGPVAGLFALQLRKAGVEATLIGLDSLSSGGARRVAGDALSGAYSFVDFYPDTTPAAKEFSRRYRLRWNTQGQSAPNLYDAIHILALAINKAGSTNPEAIRSELLKIQGYAGASGMFTFDEHGDGLRSFSVIRVEAGRLAFVKTMSFEQ
jgi:branched-chain amino acid transport system substrate-binding protein